MRAQSPVLGGVPNDWRVLSLAMCLSLSHSRSGVPDSPVVAAVGAGATGRGKRDGQKTPLLQIPTRHATAAGLHPSRQRRVSRQQNVGKPNSPVRVQKRKQNARGSSKSHGAVVEAG